MSRTQAAQPADAASNSSSVLADPATSSRADKRGRILDAAIKVFAEKGYHGCRISDIASEAGIAYGLVYHYFKNKDEILGSIFEDRWGGFLRALEEIEAQEASTREKLERVAALILGAYHVRPEWVKVLVLEIQRSSRFASPEQLRAVGRLFQIVARIVRTGQERGEVRASIDPEIACYAFVGALEIVITSAVLHLSRQAPEPPGEAEDRRYYEKVAGTVVDVFLNGVATDGARR